MHIYIYGYWWKYIHTYAVYHTAGFSIIRCILSMLKNFLTYCHALREIRYWRKEHTFVRKSSCCGIILHGFEISVWYATWITVLQKVKHVLRVYSPTFNIHQYIYIYVYICIYIYILNFWHKKPIKFHSLCCDFSMIHISFHTTFQLVPTELTRGSDFWSCSGFRRWQGCLGYLGVEISGRAWATLFCR